MEWNLDQVASLQRLYGSRSDKWLAEQLGHTIEDVRAKAVALALSKNKRTFQGGRMPRWGDAELAVLREQYPTTSNLDLAHLLGRSVKSVTSKASKMRLVKTAERLKAMGRSNVSKRRGRT